MENQVTSPWHIAFNITAVVALVAQGFLVKDALDSRKRLAAAEIEVSQARSDLAAATRRLEGLEAVAQRATRLTEEAQTLSKRSAVELAAIRVALRQHASIRIEPTGAIVSPATQPSDGIRLR